MAISLGSGFFTIRAKDEASGAVRGMAEGIRGQLADVAQTSLDMMAVAGTAVLGFIGASVKAFADSERASAQLEAALTSTGHAAGLTKGELVAYAEAVQKKTAYEDDSVVSAEALLLTFTNIGRTVFPQAMDAILDMSTAMGQDLKSSVIQVGKALNDPIKGITALTRVGVSFSEEQKAVIESLVETGQTAAAQQMIIAELAKEFGGSAAAEATTFTGKLKQMWNQFDDLQEQIGGAVVPALQALLEHLRPVMEEVSKWMSDNPNQTASILEWAAGISGAAIALRALQPIVGLVIKAVELLGTVIGAIAAADDAPMLVIIGVIGAVAMAAWALVDNWEGVKQGLVEVWLILGEAFSAWGDDFSGSAGQLMGYITKIFTQPGTEIVNTWNWVVMSVEDTINGLMNMIGAAWEKLKEFWSWAKETAGSAMGWNADAMAGPEVPGMATGGRVGKGGIVEVGERGKELLYLPRGAEVVPARETAAMLRGGTNGAVSVNISMGGVVVREEADMDTMVRKMTRALEGVLSQRGVRMAGA